MVRLALVTSVTCTPPRGPPVRFHSTHESAVPKIASPCSASVAHPVDVLQNPLHLAAGEVRGRRQSGLCLITSPRPSRSSAEAMRSVRVSCQTIAL